MIEFLLAGAAGVATIASPCILPVLPIVLATTAGRSKHEPLLIIAGFVGSFAVSGIALAAITDASGELQQGLRTVAIWALLLAGLACVWSAPFEWVASRVQAWYASRQLHVASEAGVPGGRRTGPLLIGASLGLVWTPCAGPILASVLALAASSQAPGKALVLLGLYALGAGLPMLAIAYGGNRLSARLNGFMKHADLLRKAFGLIAVAVAVLQLLHYDVALIAWATQWLPSVSTGL